jgi:hypothetical protein
MEIVRAESFDLAYKILELLTDTGTRATWREMQAAPSNLSSQDIKAYAMHKQKSQVDERAML